MLSLAQTLGLISFTLKRRGFGRVWVAHGGDIALYATTYLPHNEKTYGMANFRHDDTMPKHLIEDMGVVARGLLGLEGFDYRGCVQSDTPSGMRHRGITIIDEATPTASAHHLLPHVRRIDSYLDSYDYTPGAEHACDFLDSMNEACMKGMRPCVPS